MMTMPVTSSQSSERRSAGRGYSKYVYILAILSCTYFQFSRVHTCNSLLLPVFLCVALVFWCRIFLYRLNYLLRKVVAISQQTTRLQRQNRDAEDHLLLHRLFVIFAIASAVRLPLTDYYPLSRNPLGHEDSTLGHDVSGTSSRVVR
jgi:hypothetical protein